MSDPYCDVLFWPEHRLSERTRKGFAQDPTELAETLLIAVAMRVHALLDPASDFTFVPVRGSYEHRKRWTASYSVLTLDRESRTVLGDALWEPDDSKHGLWHSYWKNVYLMPSESLPAVPLAAKDPQHHWKLIDDIFNHAAELLSDLHRRHEGEAAEIYLSKAALAEQAAGKAKIDHKLVEAFKNRQAMAALMTGDWLGLRLLSEITDREKITISDLFQIVGGDIDVIAAVLAQLVGSGLVDVSDKFFICTSRGSSILRTLEEAIHFNDAEQSLGTGS